MTRKQLYEMMLHKMTHIAVMQKEVRELRVAIKQLDRNARRGEKE